MDEKIAILKQYPDIRIHIEGHTCNIGSIAVNKQTGMQRAETAKAYLISQGIEDHRILTVTSKWYLEPLAPNINEENRKINRRVQFIIEK